MALASRILGLINVGVEEGPTGEVAIISKNVTPVSVAANTTASQNIAFDAGDAPVGATFVFISGPEQAGIMVESVGAIVTADTLPVKFGNLTAGPLTPTAGVYQFMRFRYF